MKNRENQAAYPARAGNRTAGILLKLRETELKKGREPDLVSSPRPAGTNTDISLRSVSLNPLRLCGPNFSDAAFGAGRQGF